MDEDVKITLAEKPEPEFSPEIHNFIVCLKCVEEWVPQEGHSQAKWSRLAVGYTNNGLQVWCLRHECSVAHFDLRGARANMTTHPSGKFPENMEPLEVDQGHEDAPVPRLSIAKTFRRLEEAKIYVKKTGRGVEADRQHLWELCQHHGIRPVGYWNSSPDPRMD